VRRGRTAFHAAGLRILERAGSETPNQKVSAMVAAAAPAPASILLTPREAASEFRCSERHLYNLRRRGVLPSVKLGKSVRFRRADLESLAERLAS
jgi:excisionase family DNA binding protein